VHTRNSRWRLPVATLLVGPLTVGLLLAGGGCPVQRAAVDDNGTVPFSDAGTGGVVDADTASGAAGTSEGDDLPQVCDQLVATLPDTPVAIELRGTSASGLPLAFSIVSAPDNGTLSALKPVEDLAAALTYTPPENFLGYAQFSFRAVHGVDESNVGTVVVLVYPPVYFDLDVTDGEAPLTVTGEAYTLTGDPLPDAVYCWNWGSEQDCGGVDTHAARRHTFIDVGTYVVSLSLALAGLDGSVGCAPANSTAPKVTVHKAAASPAAPDGSSPELPAMEVTLTSGFSSCGEQGGPFDPPSMTYTVKNLGNQTLSWRASITQAWVSLSPSSGKLGGGARANVVVTINSQADTLTAGTYHDTVKLVNASGGSGGTTRALALTVAALQNPTISGRVLDGSGPGMAGVVMAGLPNELVTDAAGYYEAVVPHGWSGQVTPSATGYTFVPAARSYSDVGSDLVDQDFVATQQTFAIAGSVHDGGGTGVPGVTIDGIPGSPVTGAEGTFSATVDYGFSGRATPVLDGYLFTPLRRDYTNVTQDRLAQDYVATPLAGPLIHGTLTLVDTVGARPPIGQQRLAFTGSGAWLGADFTTTTEVDGTYYQVVPEGWTGTVAAAEPQRMLLLSPQDQWVYADGGDAPPVTENQQLDFTVWTAPIGIPMPEFGIKETHWMYAGQRFDFDGDGQLEPGEEYPDAGNGPYTHYVDNTDPAATDTANPYGTPTKPRLSIPTTLAAGSVVEIHGGPYTTAWTFSSPGLPDRPIFIRGVDSVTPKLLGNGCRLRTSYVILENIDFDMNNVETAILDVRPVNADPAAVHHVAVRSCEIHNYDDTPTHNGSAVGVGSYTGTADRVHNIVFYNCHVYHNGDSGTLGFDVHGFTVHRNVERMWLVDSHVHNNAADSIQLQYYDTAPYSAPRYVYIGRSDMHDGGENAIDLKGCSDVIISQNHLHAFSGIGPDSDGTAMVFHADSGGKSTWVWVIANEVYECLDKASSCTSGVDEIYFIGNVIHDISNPDNLAAGGGLAFSSWESERLYVCFNTVYRCDTGLHYDGVSDTAKATIVSNIFGDMNYPDRSIPQNCSYHLRVDRPAYQARAVLEYNLFYQPTGSVYISWDHVYTGLAAFLDGVPGKGAGCLEDDPVFVDEGGDNVQLGTGSPAVDAGMAGSIFDTYWARYGVDIQYDFHGQARPRPVDGLYDIGAHEQ